MALHIDNPNNQRFTIYDSMTARGYFRSNPANANAAVVAGESIYKGPVQWPKMVYFPVEDIVSEGSWEKDNSPDGRPYLSGQQKALRSRSVANQDEFDEALASGWVDHPAKAMKEVIESNIANGVKDKRIVPPISTGETVSRLERELEETKAKLAKAQEDLAIRPVHLPPKVAGPTTQAA